MRFPTSERASATVPGAARARDLGAVLLLAVALGCSPFLASGCGTRRAQRQPRVAVTVARVERRPMPVQIVTSGTIEPVQTANVGSQVGGVVQRIAIEEGQDVSAGQLLIELDPRPFRAALEQARGALARDRAQWESARLDAERADRLLEQNLISPSDHDKANATADAFRAAVQADSGTVANARLNLEFAGIRAPIGGRTGRLNVHVGDLVKAGTSDPLVTINQLSPIRVSFTVPQDQIPLIQRYREARPRVFVSPSGGDSLEIEGRLAFVDNAVDPATGTLLLKGEIANRDGALWPGEFVQLRLVLTMEPDAIVVPAPAVTIGQQGAYVYVLNPDSTATPRPVTVKRTDDVTAVVASGLEPGETVVTDGQFRLAPGAKVLVRKAGQGTRP
jgi:multidrug efflux system membrane fusion protein